MDLRQLTQPKRPTWADLRPWPSAEMQASDPAKPPS